MDCSRCSSDPKIVNKQSALVGELCEGHFLYTYVTPLQKERENSEKIVSQLTREIQHQLAILHKAKNIDRLSTEEAAKRMLERQKRVQRGELVALGYQYCAKCHAPFESAIERIMHEEDCRVLSYGKSLRCLCPYKNGTHSDDCPAKQGKVRAKSAKPIEVRDCSELENME